MAVLVGLFASPAGAATIPGCNNPADSALNQYCELIPTATGGQTPGGGGPGLGATLSSAALNRIRHRLGPQARSARALLTLPTALQVRRVAALRHASVTEASSAALPAWLYVALMALALALLGGALVRWWRRRPSGPGPGDIGA